MRYLITLLSWMIVTVALPGQSEKAEIGETAPPISLENLLKSSEKLPLTWSDLKGKSVVIDFWGTWCGPCIQTLPHMNQLALEFKDKPIRFIAVTDEDQETVEKFLASHQIDALIGLDTNGSMFSSYGVWSVPFTVLVDSSGIVRDLTHPIEVSSDKLDALIDGRLRTEEERPKMGRAARIIVIPSDKTFAVRREGKNGARELLGYPFLQLVSTVYSFPIKRIRVNIQTPDQRFDVIIPPGQGQVGILLLQKILESSVGFRVSHSEEDVKVMVLRKVEGFAGRDMSGLNPEPFPSWTKGILQANNTTELAAILEAEMDNPVVDETGLTGDYLIYLKTDREGLEGNLRSVGFKLESATRRLEILTVEQP